MARRRRMADKLFALFFRYLLSFVDSAGGRLGFVYFVGIGFLNRSETAHEEALQHFKSGIIGPDIRVLLQLANGRANCADNLRISPADHSR